jgi:hypothetical protein
MKEVAECIRQAALKNHGSYLLGALFGWGYIETAALAFVLEKLGHMTDNYYAGTDTERRMFLLFCSEAYE